VKLYLYCFTDSVNNEHYQHSVQRRDFGNSRSVLPL